MLLIKYNQAFPRLIENILKAGRKGWTRLSWVCAMQSVKLAKQNNTKIFLLNGNKKCILICIFPTLWHAIFRRIQKQKNNDAIFQFPFNFPSHFKILEVNYNVNRFCFVFNFDCKTPSVTNQAAAIILQKGKNYWCLIDC